MRKLTSQYELFNKYMAMNHGGKRAWLTMIKTKALSFVGMYSSYFEIDFVKVSRVVFVCHGNICRSSFAEKVAERMGIRTASFGLSTSTGASSPQTAVMSASKFDISLEKHVATDLGDFELLPGDLLIGFEPHHCTQLKAIAQDFKGIQITLAGLWKKPTIPYIHDPYSCNEEYFDRCYSHILSIVENLNGRLTAGSYSRQDDQ